MSLWLLQLLPKLWPEKSSDLATEVFAAFGAFVLGFVLLQWTATAKRCGWKVQGEKCCAQGATTAEPCPVDNLTALPKELQAKVFSFTAVEGLLQLSTSSPGRRDQLRESQELWKHFIAESGLPSPEDDTTTSTAQALHDHVRVKSLGIDDQNAPWRADVVASTAYVGMLEDATKVCRGLHSRDGQDLIQKNLADIVDLLRTYDVTCEEARKNAQGLVKTIVGRGKDGLFQQKEVSEAMNAYTESLELYEMLNNAGNDEPDLEADPEDYTMIRTSLEDSIEAEYEESRSDFVAQGEAVNRVVDKLREILNDMQVPSEPPTPKFATSEVFDNRTYLVADI